MLPDAALTRSELLRKAVHLGCGGFAFLLRFLAPWQAALFALAAFVHNWFILPHLGGRRLWREADRRRGYPIGIYIYPLAVLALILWFRGDLVAVAALWALMAFGDGMASVAGQAFGGPRLPWNVAKGWTGFFAFVLCGGGAAAVLIPWTSRLSFAVAAPHWPRTLALAFGLALVGALVESVPTTLDDNLTLPLVTALVWPLLAAVSLPLLLEHPQLGARLGWGLGVNGLVAVVAFLVGSIDILGAVAAVLIGTAITVGLGLPALGQMIMFFVLGTTATRVGYRIKASRGIAQERGGRRGLVHALANGGVPAFLALVAGLTRGPDGAALALAYAAAVATAAADTCSSEVGKAYGRRTFLITTLRPVPPGTEGAVSLEGTLGGFVGALLVAVIGPLGGAYGWVVALAVAVAGLLGSLAESVIGTVAERRGWMGNDMLNALNTAIGAILIVLIFRLLLLAGIALS
jgi:uncharacterized protein (TIGR00297 family)